MYIRLSVYSDAEFILQSTDTRVLVDRLKSARLEGIFRIILRYLSEKF